MTLQRRLQLVRCNTDDRWIATALKVAFATSDMRQVDQHFGAARSFAVYALDCEKSCLVEAITFAPPAMDGNEDKLAAKIAALAGCIAVYSQAVGASAINQLKAKGIQPAKVSPGAVIADLLASLQDELKQGQGSWLARAVDRATPADPRGSGIRGILFLC